MSEKIIQKQSNQCCEIKGNEKLITINDLRSCENCGNIFLKKIADKLTNRCPACKVWEKQV
jgi:predicted Zn-ribbon and HTH transcriptional regulator